MAAASAIAENASTLKSMFITQSRTKSNAYAFKWWIGGSPRPVIVDDHVPMRRYSNGQWNTVFAGQDATRGLWVPIMEKAWAKVHGNYEMIAGGWSTEAWSSMLGVPT